jgi:hypothetical protein
MRTFNKQLVSAQALNASFNSAAIPLKNIIMYAMAFIVTGTPTGTVVIQASNDPETNDVMPEGVPSPTVTNWVTIANSSFTLSAAGETMWNVTDVGYNYVRVSYTDSSSGSSTAHAKIVFNGKGL